MWNDGVVFVPMARWRARFTWWCILERSIREQNNARAQLARLTKKPADAVWGRWHERREARRQAKAARS
jgi:hypothetical protein